MTPRGRSFLLFLFLVADSYMWFSSFKFNYLSTSTEHQLESGLKSIKINTSISTVHGLTSWNDTDFKTVISYLLYTVLHSKASPAIAIKKDGISKPWHMIYTMIIIYSIISIILVHRQTHNKKNEWSSRWTQFSLKHFTKKWNNHGGNLT